MGSWLKSGGVALAVLAFLAGAALVGYGRWTAPVAEGDTALSAGQLDRALAGYAAAERRFDALPVTRQLFAREHARTVTNQLWALYRLGRYDDTVDKAEHAPAGAAPHFWAGCAFFQKAAAEEKPEGRLGWLTRAEEEFRQAVEAEPQDWDAKFDFELTTRLVAALKKQPKTPPAQMMQLLRPPPPSGKPVRRVG